MTPETYKETINMGSVNPIEYHCKRCHRNLKTKKRKRLYHEEPKKCGRQGCSSAWYASLPEVCFESDFDPFTTKTNQDRLPFVHREGGFYCKDCFFEWAEQIKRLSHEEALQLWELRPYKELEPVAKTGTSSPNKKTIRKKAAPKKEDSTATN